MKEARTGTQEREPTSGSGVELTLEALAEEAWQLRDEDPARAQTLVAAQLEQAAHDPFGRALGLIVQAFLTFREARYDLALEQAFEAQMFLGDRGSLSWQARLLNTLGCIYVIIGERSLGLEHFQKQLMYAQASGVQDDIFLAYHDIAVYFAMYTNAPRALEYFQKAAQHLPADPRSQALLNLNLACYYANVGAFDRAVLPIEKALDLSSSIIRVFEIALGAEAYIATKRGDHDEALAVYRRMLKFQRDTGLSSAMTALRIAASQLALGDTQRALGGLNEVLGDVKVGGSKNFLAESHRLLSEAYKRNGEFEKALEHYERFHSLHEAVFNENSETRVRALEVTHRMESLRQESERLRQKNESLERHNQELQELHQRVHELSIRDALTGLYNRRHLFDHIDQFFRLTRRYGQPLGVAMLDIDHFKGINDLLGHKMGDAVLERVGAILRSALRETDFAARYGGEEFAVVMPNTTLEDATMTCERLRQLIGEFDWGTLHPGLKVTVSIGLASSSALGPDEGDELFVVADEQLYLAKRSGRDRVRF